MKTLTVADLEIVKVRYEHRHERASQWLLINQSVPMLIAEIERLWAVLGARFDASYSRPVGGERPTYDGTCRAGKDGDCSWVGCPQARDDEPASTGRACPLHYWNDNESVGAPPVDDDSGQVFQPYVQVFQPSVPNPLPDQTPCLNCKYPKYFHSIQGSKACNRYEQ